MPFGDVSGRVGHILGPSVEFAFGQPLLGQLYELVLRSCSVLHTKHSKISCSTILMLFVRGVPLSTSLPLRAQRTAIKSSTLPTCLHCALHRAKYELCDGMMLRRSSSVPLQLSRSHPTARRRATGTPRSSRERRAPAPAGPRTCAVHDPHPCDPEAPGASVLSFGRYRTPRSCRERRRRPAVRARSSCAPRVVVWPRVSASILSLEAIRPRAAVLPYA